MALAKPPELIPQPAAPVISLSVGALLAGAGGMLISFLFLASSNHLDVIAGAVGFLAGTILVSSGLLSLGIQSRSPTTSQAATHAAGCLMALLPPVVAILGWPVVDSVAFFAVLLIMPPVLSCCLAWAWIQSRAVAGHLSALLEWPRAGPLRVTVFTAQSVFILASWPLFVRWLRFLESMGYKIGWS